MFQVHRGAAHISHHLNSAVQFITIAIFHYWREADHADRTSQILRKNMLDLLRKHFTEHPSVHTNKIHPNNQPDLSKHCILMTVYKLSLWVDTVNKQIFTILINLLQSSETDPMNSNHFILFGKIHRPQNAVCSYQALSARCSLALKKHVNEF